MSAKEFMSNTKAKVWTAILTVVVMGAVFILNGHIIPYPEHVPRIIYKFPACIATINALCSLVLICTFVAVKSKKIALHKKLNLAAMTLSALFLVLYISAHYFIPDTKFGDIDHNNILSNEERTAAGTGRSIYFAILGSHILLAAIVFPMVLMTFHYGWTNQVEKHKKLARYSFPIWLYVAITGVVVYFLISPYYNF
jgi:putative membrane protein